MMNFKELLLRAKAGDLQAEEAILERYRPLLLRLALVNTLFDEDLYQELCITLIRCIRTFQKTAE